MYAVIFEVEPAPGRRQDYLDIAAQLRPELEKIDGFISVERFQSLTQEGKILSLSFWRDEEAVARWRRHEQHRDAQRNGLLRSEEHTSELQSQSNLVCRLLLEKKKTETVGSTRYRDTQSEARRRACGTC